MMAVFRLLALLLVGGVASLPQLPFKATIVPYGAPTLSLRHCNYDLFATTTSAGGPPTDHAFTVVNALNRKAGLVSFRSVNFPTKYITVDNRPGLEAGRLGIADVSGTGDSASFSLQPAAANTSLYTIANANGVFYVNSLLEGPCSGSYTGLGSDVVMSKTQKGPNATFYVLPPPPPPPAPPVTVSFDPTKPQHPINPFYMGCHSDSGFTHEERGFYSQMIYGESFEAGPKLPISWNWVTPSSVIGTAAFDGSTFFHGFTSLAISYESGTGLLGTANRGLGNEGLYFEGSKQYEGYFFAKSDGPVDIVVAVQDYTAGNKTLGSATVHFAGGNWTLLNFSLTVSAETPCVGIEPGSDPNIDCGAMGPASHICVRCSGQVTIGLASKGSVNIDYVFLQPGAWGLARPDLPVLSSGVDILKDIGVTMIRQGGSFIDPTYYFWKNWRGKPWERPSLQAEWGAELISGWGPFEMIDMCEVAGFRPVITTTAQAAGCCEPDDMADLVEYCFGDETTDWGKTRINDGHPRPYNVTIFELGNEQYNTVFVEQVAAMEARARTVGMGGKLYYMFPQNKYLNPADLAKAEALGLKDHLLADLHVGGGGAVEESQALFQNKALTAGTINCETNAATHTMHRALSEGQDMSDFFSTYLPSTSNDNLPRLKARTASFCNERSGHYDAFDQGITFFLPNMTWIQPPGYVHKMIKDTWQPYALDVVLNTSASISAQVSADGHTVRAIVTNPNDMLEVTFNTISGKLGPSAEVTSLASDDLDAANSPGSPSLVSPKTSFVPLANGTTITVPANSVNVVVLTVS
eukprot:m.328061 g.328061  ORF g.328061 m.328061 type:complete len:807 (-) comp19750_c0_seq31:149-2569(-)